MDPSIRYKWIFTLCTLAPLSLCAQNGTWIATTFDDLENGANWSSGSTPTEVAIFDSTQLNGNLYPQVTTGGTSLTLTNFTFPNQASFLFTINGPNALDFFGAGCGITGTNTNTTIKAINTVAGMTVSQLVFSGAGAAVGNANLHAVVQSGASLTNVSITNNLAQILFDGSGDSPNHICTLVMNSPIASMRVNNYGSITTTTTSINNVGQIVFDGSGGKSANTIPGTGFSEVIIGGGVVIAADNAENLYVENNFQANNIAQILFDGSGGLSSTASGSGFSTVTIGGQAQILATLPSSNIVSQGVGNNVAQIAFDGSGGTSLGAGGQGSSTVVIKDSAIISATAPDYGYVGYYTSGPTSDTAQILFSGNGGLSYGGSGSGSSVVTITDSATLFASNTYYLTAADPANDAGQIIFDGSGGTGKSIGGHGSSTVTINGNARITAENTLSGYIYSAIADFNDLAQILFDGTPGTNREGGGSGFSSVIIGGNAQLSTTTQESTYIVNSTYANDVGQIVFDGSGGFGWGVSTGNGLVLSIQDQATLSASNAASAEIIGGYGNNCGQIIFDGGGGFQYDYAGKGSAQITLKDAAQINAVNAGTLVGNGVSSNDVAQILFDGSGGANVGSGGTGQTTGSCQISIGDTACLRATNSGTLGSTSSSACNNIAQILMDGSGGANQYGGGAGHLTAAISTSSQIAAVNERGGSISNVSSSTSNKIGQIIFDGGEGLTPGGPFPHSGNLAVTLGKGAAISATNSGTIAAAGPSQGTGQILFDGRGGSCNLILGSENTIVATNTASGSVQGDQIAFYDTVVEGEGTVSAINQGGSVTHGIAFYGPTTTAENLKLQLIGTSLWIDPTVSDTFTIGALSGDTSSTVILNQSSTFKTSAGQSSVFQGSTSGSAGITIIGNGQQVLAGTNSHTGDTKILSGTLTLQNCNLAGLLFVENGGIFSGTGTIVGSATIHGTVHPGNSPGTLTFLNGLTLSSSSTVQIEVAPQATSLLAVSGGNAIIAGTLDVIEDAYILAQSMFPIVTVNGGSVIGTFSTITSTGPYIPVVEYSNNEVTLALQNPPSTFAVLLNTPDRILRNTETLKHIDTQRQSRIKTPQAPPIESEDDATVKVLVCRAGIPGLQKVRPLAWKEPEVEHEEKKPWSAYVEPTGSFGHVKSRHNVFGNDFQTLGARVGCDYLWSNIWCFGLGLIAEYNHWWGQLYHRAGKFFSNTAYGSLYATFAPKQLPELSINAVGGGGYSWYTFHRYPLGSYSLETKGHPAGAQADALLDVEYTFRREQFASFPKHFYLTSLIAAQYTYANINGYSEKGAGIYDLHMQQQSTSTLSSLLGFRTGYFFSANDSSITVCPEVIVQWQYQYFNSSVHTHTTSLPAGPTDFPLVIPGFASNSLIAGTDLRIDFYKKAMIRMNYDLWYNRTGLINFFLIEYKTQF